MEIFTFGLSSVIGPVIKSDMVSTELTEIFILVPDKQQLFANSLSIMGNNDCFTHWKFPVYPIYSVPSGGENSLCKIEGESEAYRAFY